MRGTASSTFAGLEDYSPLVNLKIWSKTGSMFEEIFSTDRTTFADVKNSALRHFTGKSTYPRHRTSLSSLPVDDLDRYKLISIELKRTIDEKKKLSEERVKDGGQFKQRHSERESSSL